MKVQTTSRSERGIALVIAIFTLMLISVVGTALILMAGTETAFKANYRTSMQAFYAAKAGLEEGRSRLSLTSPSNIQSCVFGAPGVTTQPTNRVCYIVNPSPGEVVIPEDPSSPYADTEYTTEYGADPAAGTVSKINSTSPEANGIAGPLYKWVRIAPRTEWAARIKLDGTQATPADNAPIYFDGQQQTLDSAGGGNPQVLTITALAVTPSSGSSGRRLLQSVVTAPADPSTIVVPSAVTGAVTMLGDNPNYQPTNSNNFHMYGLDRNASDQAYPNCTLPRQPNVNAIGVTTNSETAMGRIDALQRDANYPGIGNSPSVANIYNYLPTSERTTTGIDGLVQGLTSSASQVLTGPVGANNVSSFGSPTNPVVLVVNGDFNFNGNVTGYGILVVTGTLSINGPAGWRGLVLVVGQGSVDGTNAGGSGEFDGTMIVAKTRDSSGNLLPNFGVASVNWANGGGNGFYYDSCWLKTMVPSVPYKTLSFREKELNQP
jgi:PilX N-terminal